MAGAREASLCDAPAILGDELDADTKTGQLGLPAGVRCLYGSTALTASGVAALAKVTRDRELALTALVARAVERERARVSPSDTLAMERRVVKARFRGSSVAYRAAVAEAGASPAVARGILGDELRSAEIVDRMALARISSGDVSRFRSTFAPVLAREVTVSPAPSWLPDGQGVALATSAPPAVFAIGGGRRTTIRTAEGAFVVEHAARRPRSAHSRPSSPAPPSRASCGRSAAPRPTPRGRFGCRRRQRASSCASGIGFRSSAS